MPDLNENSVKKLVAAFKNMNPAEVAEMTVIEAHVAAMNQNDELQLTSYYDAQEAYRRVTQEATEMNFQEITLPNEDQ